MSISIKDSGLRRAFEGLLSDRRVSKAEVDQLIESTKDGPGLAKTEKADLSRILEQAGDRFDADAKAALRSFLGISTSGVPTSGVSSTGAAIEGGASLAETFAREVGGRAGASVPETSRAGWWAGIAKAPLDGALFPEPLKDSVTVDGVIFTRQDTLDLLMTLAEGAARSREPLVSPARVKEIYEALVEK